MARGRTDGLATATGSQEVRTTYVEGTTQGWAKPWSNSSLLQYF